MLAEEVFDIRMRAPRGETAAFASEALHRITRGLHRFDQLREPF